MRIVFIGSVKFSQIALLKLLDLKANIVGIVTKQNSSYNSDFVDLSEVAKSNNIPYKYVNDINHLNNVNWIKELNPDILFCFGWSNLIKKELLNLCKLGVIGYHPSLLPDNKGRHPLIWAKVLGLKKTGSTFFFMDEGADTGDILDQAEFEISFEDDINDIYYNMTQIAVAQIEEFYPKLVNNTYKRERQIAQGNTWRKRYKSDGLIDFRMTSVNITNLVRGLKKPFPGAYCVIGDIEYNVWEVELGFCSNKNIEPGKILSIEKQRIEIKTGDSSIFLIDHELPILSLGEYVGL